MIEGFILRAGLIALLLTVSGTSVMADAWPQPLVHWFDADWPSADSSIDTAHLQTGAPSENAVATLTTATSKPFPAVATTPVPVLLPFDVTAYIADQSIGNEKPLENYLSGFKATPFFLAGPSGYDAVFSLRSAEVDGLKDVGFSNPILVTISAFRMIYDLPQPVGASTLPAPEIESLFPGIRRQILEHTLRYSFERFGIPYVVSIQCFDGPQTRRRLSCKNANRVALRFLRALQFAGGVPDKNPGQPMPGLERPERVSEDFTYHPSGSLIPGTAIKAQTGRADSNVYAKIRFPLAESPAFVNSQSFMNWGDCNQTGRRPVPRRKDQAYRCRVNTKPLVFNEGSPDNYSYPWRDNFCEHRHFAVGQCPSGLGHQGQDIRPSSCDTRNAQADRCMPYRHDVVAARDGMILRETWQESFLLFVNAPGQRLRFRHLHMHPDRLDTDGIRTGKRAREGEVIGKVGNFNRRDGWTTTHLHFELQVPTRDGWVRVNPYMTLVAAYEHLLGARGTEIDTPEPEPSVSNEAPVEAAVTAVTATAAKVTATRTTARAKHKAKRPVAVSTRKATTQRKARGKQRRR